MTATLTVVAGILLVEVVFDDILSLVCVHFPGERRMARSDLGTIEPRNVHLVFSAIFFCPGETLIHFLMGNSR